MLELSNHIPILVSPFHCENKIECEREHTKYLKQYLICMIIKESIIEDMIKYIFWWHFEEVG